MSKYVPDISSRRWVIISSSRQQRPDDYERKQGGQKPCPFCPGNEAESPHEVYRIGKGEKNQPGWEVRVVANKYPVTDLHEVIIHSPDCCDDIIEYPLEHTEKLLKTYVQRYNFHRKNGQVLIFCNHGEGAGASLDHPHSQLVVIPFQINLDALSREPHNNVVHEGKSFDIFCPDFSQWPYEVWVAPKIAGTLFGDITEPEIAELADLMQKILARLRDIHKREALSRHPFAYNFYIHPRESWYIRIIPRFVYRAGFELGTGLNVNVVDPEIAAIQLQENLFEKNKETGTETKTEAETETKSKTATENKVESVLEKLKGRF